MGEEEEEGEARQEYSPEGAHPGPLSRGFKGWECRGDLNRICISSPRCALLGSGSPLLGRRQGRGLSLMTHARGGKATVRVRSGTSFSHC